MATTVAAGHDVVVLDDLSNADVDVVDRLSALIGHPIEFHHTNILDTVGVERALPAKRSANESCRTSAPMTLGGASPRCATSIRPAPTPVR